MYLQSPQERAQVNDVSMIADECMELNDHSLDIARHSWIVGLVVDWLNKNSVYL